MKKQIAFLFIISLFFFNCSLLKKEITVGILVKNSIEQSLIDSFIANIPTSTTDNIPISVVRLENLDDEQKSTYKNLIEIEISGTFDILDNNNIKNHLILKTETYAPYTEYYSTSMDIIVNNVHQKKDYKLLDAIKFPQKALTVTGLYAGDEKYPLDYKTLLKVPNFTEEEKDSLKYSAWAEIHKKLLEKYPPIATNTVTTVAFSGDIMAGRGVDVTLQKKDGLQKVFSDTLPIFVNSDLSIGNLEGAVTTYQNKVYKSYNFKYPYSVLPKLKEAGFDYLTVANNHSFDFGMQGFLDTMANLEKADVGTSGIGKTLDEALKPWQTSIQGVEFNVFSLADYPSEMHFSGRKETEVTEKSAGVLWPCDELYESIRKFSTNKNSFNIVLVHAGQEWQNSPSQRQINLYKKLIDAGADMVIGSHPHVLQPIEMSEKGFIAYSIGNFIFPGMDETDFGEETIALQVGIWKNSIKYINLHPVQLSQIGVSIDKTQAIENRFFKMNENWYIKNKQRDSK